MNRAVLIILALLMFTPNAFSADDTYYKLDFDVEASSNEHPAEACTRKTWTGRKDLGVDCEINTNGADELFICYDTNLDVLGTHAATDWSLLVRAIATPDGTYPTAGSVTGGDGTDPTSTDYYEYDNLGNDDIGCFALTTGHYAIKIRVKTPSATVAAPTITVKSSIKPN